MKLAIVSDIHGNLEALETALADARRRSVERYYCLGDFVGYGAAPNECIDRLRPLIDGAVAGNHDLAACGRIRLGYFNPDAATAARWTAEVLRPEQHEYLRALPWSEPWHGAFMVHASPAEPDQWHYVFSPGDAALEMEACPAPLCFIGHSHVPGNFELDGERVRYHRELRVDLHPERRYLVNVPSVGQPRDGDPRAGYLVWDTEAQTLEHVRLEYDIASAMARIRAAGLPGFLADRLQWGE
jgi:diadenosine tetraphosphatase ApaH/serine/threonine PP2A family protein phosphatase